MKNKIIILLLLIAVMITANSGSPRLSPWDAWRMAYTSFEQGEEFRDKGEYTKAKKAFDKALEYYNMVRESRPDWNQKVIAERIVDCEKESRRMSAFLGPAADKKEKAPSAPRQTAQSSQTEKMRKELSEAKAELAELRQRNEIRKNYETEISNLLRDQRILNERYSLLEKRYRAQEARLSEPDQKLRKFEEQVVAMRLQLDLARKEAAAARQQSSRAVMERNAMHKEKNAADNARRRAAEEVAAMRKENLSQNALLQKLRQELSDSAKREKGLAVRLETDHKKLQTLTSELNQLQIRYREKLAASGAGAAANAKLLEENKRLQESNAAMRKNEGDLLARNAAMQKEIDSQRRQLAAELGKNTQNSRQIKLQDVRLEALSKELEREKNNTVILNRELESMRRNAGSSADELKKLNAENKELKKRLKFRDSEDFKNLTAAREERKKLKDEILRQEQTIGTLRTELKISGEKYTALDRSNRELLSENRKLHAGRISYEDRLKALSGVSANSQELARQYAELKKNFTALQAENRQNKLAAEAAKPREAELARIKLRLAELDGLKQQLRREQSFNEQLNAVKNRLEREVRTLRSAGKENEELKAKLTDHQLLKSEVERLRKLNRELAEAQKLAAQVADLKMELAKVTPEAAEAGKLRRQNRELLQGKVLWENEIAKMKVTLAAMKQQEQQLKTARSDLEKRSRQLENANRTITRLTAENRTLGTSVNDLETLRTKSRRLVDDQAKTLQQLRGTEEELSRTRVELASQSRTAKRTGEELLETRQKLATASRTLSDLHLEIGKLRKLVPENARLQRTLAQIQREFKELQNQKGTSAASAPAVLPQKADTAAAQQIAALKKKLSELQNVNEENRQLRNDLLQANSDARQRQTASAKELALLARKLKDEEKTSGTLLKENQLLKNVNSKNLTLEQELASARILNNRMRSELEQLRPIRAELARLSKELKKNTDALRITKQQNNALLAAAAETRRISAENSNILQINKELSNRSLKAESELAALKSELADYSRLRAEAAQLRRVAAELADAKSLAPELAQAKLRIARLEQMRDELVRQRRLNEELSRKHAELEKELAARPMPAFAPADFIPGASSKPVGKAIDYISAGQIAAADDKNDLAIWNYRTALKLEPENSQAAELLGKLLALRGDFAEAAPMLSRARNAKPDSLDLALATAYAYIELKRFGNAEAVIDPIFKRNPDNPQLQIAAALIAAGNGQHARAAGLLRLAAARLPNDPLPKLELARLLYNTDTSRVFEAVKLYETARRQGAAPDLELEPKLASLLNKRSNMTSFLNSAAAEAARNKDWNSVIWYNRQLIDLDREPEKYRPRLAFAQYKKGSSGAALETLSMGNNTPLGLITKAFIHLMRKEKREAMQCAAQARSMNHGNPVALPADWTEFILEFRKHGKELSRFAN